MIETNKAGPTDNDTVSSLDPDEHSVSEQVATYVITAMLIGRNVSLTFLLIELFVLWKPVVHLKRFHIEYILRHILCVVNLIYG